MAAMDAIEGADVTQIVNGCNDIRLDVRVSIQPNFFGIKREILRGQSLTPTACVKYPQLRGTLHEAQCDECVTDLIEKSRLCCAERAG